jgi:hypothetical protein
MRALLAAKTESHFAEKVLAKKVLAKIPPVRVGVSYEFRS